MPNTKNSVNSGTISDNGLITVSVSNDRRDIALGAEFRWAAADSGFNALLVAGADAVPYSLTSFTPIGYNYAVGTTSDGRKIEVRPTRHSDLADSRHYTVPSIPLPLAVVAGILFSEGDDFQMPKVNALSDDEGFVVTLMLDSSEGLYVRSDGAWHLLTNPDTVDGLNITEVADNAVTLFDENDQSGDVVALSEYVNDAMESPKGGVASPDSAVTASAAEEFISLRTEEDIPVAIQAAIDSPEMQWWVERRLKALGLEAELPWTQ